MDKAALVFVVPIFIEALVEYAKNIFGMFEGGNMKAGIIQIVTVIIGVLMAVLFNADMFGFLGISVNHIAGMIITGIIFSRGSNYVSDLIKRVGGGNNKIETVG